MLESEVTDMSSQERVSRRTFLGHSVASVVGASIGLSGVASALDGHTAQEDTGQIEKPAGEKPSIKEYRRFGSTGWKVSDVSFGNATMQDTSTLEYAMERGINYVDTARQYYDMEKVIGQLFPAKRDKLFVTTKLLPELFTADTTVEQVTTAIDESLERLNSDYIDGCLIHSVGEDPKKPDRTRIDNDNIYTAFEKAKQAGKIRFWGASSHGPKMIEEYTWLLENTGIGIIMPGMNYMTQGLEPLLARAKKKGVAVVAMKSLSAAKKIDYKPFLKQGRTVRQAVLKWMLAQPGIDTIAITMPTFEAIDEYVAVSGTPVLTPEEKKALEGYGMLLERDYCRPGCDGCMNACPHNVPIPDILRYRLYFHNYGREKYAMSLYARLPGSRSVLRCMTCTGTCEQYCPYRLDIRNKLLCAHDELTV